METVSNAARRSEAEINRLRDISKMETVEKTLEQHVDEYDAGKFDPMKEFEVSNGSSWHRPPRCSYSPHYVGISAEGMHVIDTCGEFLAYPNIRNIPEFNASMLNEGETMLVERSDIPDVVPGNILFRYSVYVLNLSNWKKLSKTDSPKVFGRKVSIESAEFKVIEI
jgi:hypothetical protein